MGIAISTNVDLTGNESLTRFIGEEQIVPNDPFWNNFLSYNISPPTSINEQLAFESKIEPFCQQLLINNLKSGNVGTLIQVFLIRASELLIATNTDDHIFSWQCFNALFAIRSILKYLTELVSEEELLQHLEYKSENVSRVESLVSSLFGIIINVPVVDYTYLVHLEAVTCLIALLSVQTHSNKRAEQSNIFRLLMKGTNSIYAPLLVKHLLINYIAQKNAPQSFGSHNHSLVLGLASDLWSMLTFRKSTTSNNHLENLSQSNDSNNVPLSNNSLLLLLILANNLTTCTNPYSLSLFSCNNSQEKNPVQLDQTSFTVDYELLFSTLCTNASSDSSTLLLYLLIHKNHLFRTFILNRPDVDQLVIPILKTLYNAPNSNSHHIYMSLIILLILSEYQSFNRLIHEMKLKSITWYTERMISEVSLGGLLVLVLIRTIQYNMLKMRDKYLHTNCLAALANMSDQFRNLHPYVSQRLVSLFETLAKRYQRLQNQLTGITNNTAAPTTVIPITTTTAEETPLDVDQDVEVLEEVLRMVLEILNSCLTNQLGNNPNLVYTLLYKRETFDAFTTHAAFQDIVRNIDVVIGYFSELLASRSAQHEVDASQVLQVIQQGAKTWSRSKLTKFPDLKFKYVEEEQPEEFFIPYVWALVSQQSTLHWSKETSQLLDAVC